MDIEKTLKELVELGLHKGDKYGDGRVSYALGYFEASVRNAILRLPAKHQKAVLDDLQAAIAWGQKAE